MKALAAFVAKYPAMTVGLLMSVVTAVATWVANGGELTWAAVAPLIAGAIIHQLVTPAGQAGPQ